MERERPHISTFGSAFGAGLLTGAAIGAGIGLLWAPRRGTEFRNEIADSLASVGRSMSSAIGDVAESGRRVYERARKLSSAFEADSASAPHLAAVPPPVAGALDEQPDDPFIPREKSVWGGLE